MKTLKFKLKFLLQRFEWLKVLNSPFKPFHIKLYAGKLAIGTPYFFPRKWVKYTEEDIQKAMEKHRANKNYVQHIDSKLYDMYKNYSKAVPIKVGFDWCSLGWKTKWTDTDFRYEWGPVFTFVFFGYQIAMMVGQKDVSHYWEAWLYYEYATDKTKSKCERVEQCRAEFNQTWKSYSGGKEEIIDYYERILKPKYLK
jgi:hypothetical protein